MTEPILSREQYEAAEREYGYDRDTDIAQRAFADGWEAALAVLEKVCGEPVAWAVLECVHLKPCSVTLDHEDVEGHRPEHIVPLYALTRSKP